MPHRPVTLSDLTDDLLWPRLLRAPSLALAPSRMVLGFFGVVLVSLALRIPDIWLETSFLRTIDQTARSISAGAPISVQAPANAITHAGGLLFGVPDRLLGELPISTTLVFFLCAAVFAIFGGAIARSAAVDFCLGVRSSTATALAFGVKRARSLIAVLLVPLILALVLRLLLSIAGGGLLSVPWLNIVAAIAFPIAIAVGVAITLMLLGYAAGFLMLTPSVACEGSDAIDGLQRVYAYVIARPLRLLSYLLVLGLLFVATLVLLRVIFHTGAYLAGDSLTRWLGERSSAVVTGHIPESLRESLAESKPRADERTAHAIFGFWWNLPGVLIASWIFSFLHCGGAILYLLMRKAADGQELAEIHRP